METKLMQWNGMECMWNRNQNKQEHPIQTQSFGFSDMDLPIFYTKFLKHVPYTPYNVTGLIKVCALLRLIRRKLESDVLSLTPTKPYGVFFHQLNSSKPPTTHPPGGPSGFMSLMTFALQIPVAWLSKVRQLSSCCTIRTKPWKMLLRVPWWCKMGPCQRRKENNTGIQIQMIVEICESQTS